MNTVRRRDSLRTRLVLLLLLASVLPLALAMLVAWASSRRLIARGVADLLAANAGEAGARLDGLHRRYAYAASRLARSKEFVELATQHEARTTAGALLARLRDGDPDVVRVALHDAEGGSLASDPPDPSPLPGSLRKALRGTIAVGGPFVAGSGAAPAFAYAAPVPGSDRRPAGVLVLWVRARAFWEALAVSSGQLGPGSAVALYDEDGVCIGHGADEGALFHPSRPLNAAAADAILAERRFGARTAELLGSPIASPGDLAGPAPPPEAILVPGGRELACARRLETVPWVLVSVAPADWVDASLGLVLTRSLLASGAILLLALVGGLSFARRVLQPVRELVAVADSVRAGDYTARVPADDVGELGALARAFNAMLEQLQASHSNLRYLVEQRSESLETAKRALEERSAHLDARMAELERLRARETAVTRTLAALAADAPAAARLAEALRETGAALRAPVIACFRMTEGALVPLAAVGISLEQARGAAPAGGGLVDEALRTRRTTAAEAGDGFDLRYDALVAEARPRAIAITPLYRGSRPVGVVAACWLGAMPDESPEMLDAVAPSLAIALELPS